jgi:hypothetical protein
VKTLPKHTGEKIRHNKDNKAARKISRKDLRKQEQDRKNPKKRKLRVMEENATEVAAKDPPKKKMKKLSSEDKKDLKENKAFDTLVNKYRSQFASNQTIVKKWFDT